MARVVRAWAYLTLAGLMGGAILITQGWLLAIGFGQH
jgi:hypothetical protein